MLGTSKKFFKILLSIWIILLVQTGLTFLASLGINNIISIKLLSENGSRGYLYINNDWANPAIFEIKKGVVFNYEIPVSASIIKNIRLDPSDSNGDLIKIYSFKVISNGNVVKTETLEQILEWNYVNIASKKLINNAVEIIGGATTPININAKISEHQQNSVKIFNYLNIKNSEKVLIIIIVAYLIYLNLKQYKILCMILLLSIFSIITFKYTNDFFSSIVNINNSIGRSIINQGISAMGNQVGIITIFIFSLIIGIIFSYKK